VEAGSCGASRQRPEETSLRRGVRSVVPQQLGNGTHSRRAYLAYSAGLAPASCKTDYDYIIPIGETKFSLPHCKAGC